MLWTKFQQGTQGKFVPAIFMLSCKRFCFVFFFLGGVGRLDVGSGMTWWPVSGEASQRSSQLTCREPRRKSLSRPNRLASSHVCTEGGAPETSHRPGSCSQEIRKKEVRSSVTYDHVGRNLDSETKEKPSRDENPECFCSLIIETFAETLYERGR